MTILLIGKKISNLKCTARCEFCEENCAYQNVVFSCCLYWKWSSIHCFLVETWLIFFLIGQYIVLCQLTVPFVFNTCYQTSLLWDSHYFSNALLVFEVKKKHFYGYSFNCMDMIIHENKTRLKGSGVVLLLLLLSSCRHNQVS